MVLEEKRKEAESIKLKAKSKERRATGYSPESHANFLSESEGFAPATGQLGYRHGSALEEEAEGGKRKA